MSYSDLIRISTIARKRLLKFLLVLALLSINLCYSAPTVMLKLKPSITVTKPDIYLRDVVALNDDTLNAYMLENLWLSHAPKYSQSMRLSADFIKEKINHLRHMPCQIQWQNDIAVNISRSGQMLDQKFIEKTAQTQLFDYLHKKFPGAHIALTLKTALKPNAVALGKLDIHYTMPINIASSMPVNVSIQINHAPALNFSIWFESHIVLKAYALSHDAARHSHINLTMLTDVMIDFAQNPLSIIDAQDFDHHWLSQSLAAGHVLQRQDLAAIAAVKANDIIEVTSCSGRVCIKTQARALNNAFVQSRLLVETLDTHQRYYVTVTDNAKATSNTFESKEIKC
ncbi:flagella basal body P-ring formation protein FlgA [Cysteiniphilum litorale]|uniref:flagella basal body P-ring formation protein FlgA n=1 Tax=Cysteiniphilum litorale TaxID=2056700 RepID=UPI003F882CD1